MREVAKIVGRAADEVSDHELALAVAGKDEAALAQLERRHVHGESDNRAA